LNIVSDNGVEKGWEEDITCRYYFCKVCARISWECKGKKGNSCMNGNNDNFATMSNNSH